MSSTFDDLNGEALLTGLVERSYRLSCAYEVLAGLQGAGTYEALEAGALPPLLELTGARHGSLKLCEPPEVARDLVAKLELELGEGRYLATLPLVAYGQTLGEIRLTGEARRLPQFRETEDWVVALGSQIASAVAARRCMAEVQRLAATDALTGLTNRGTFEQRLTVERLRAQRYGSPLSLVLMDLDYFKAINDTHGHATGDAVLQGAAALLGAGLRQVDVAARFGGEEFVLLLPETSLDDARLVAERLRAALAACTFTGPGGEALERVTASFGVAAFRPDDPPEALVSRADAALYHAKRTGRNRVSAESDPVAVLPSERSEPALRSLERQQREFMSNASHELRTPLSAIVGFAELLEDGLGGPLLPTQREYVEQIQRGANQLLVLIETLLDCSRIESGGIELSLREFDLTALLQESLALQLPAALEAGIRLEGRYPAEPCLFRADLGRVAEIARHLLTNALKFTPRGGRISLTLTRHGETARVEIRDTGIGVPPEKQAELFAKFHQLDAGATRSAGGLGLGLFAAKALVEAHGGKIGCRSTFGDGSLFWFTLPGGA